MFKNMGLSTKIILMVVFVVLLTAGSSIYLAYRNASEALQESVGVRLEGIAATAALMIDGDLHDKVRREEDAKKPAFLKLRAILRKIRTANHLETDVYTLRRISEKRALKYVVMSNETPFVGDSYTLPALVRPTYNKVSKLHKTGYTGIYRSANGWWITAYAPILNSKGKLSGVLSVDTKLTTYQAELRAKITPLLVNSSVLLMFGLLLGFFFSNRLVRRLRKLTELTEQMSLGQSTEAIPITSTDEVGQLARALNRMWESLRRALELLDDDDDDFD